MTLYFVPVPTVDWFISDYMKKINNNNNNNNNNN